MPAAKRRRGFRVRYTPELAREICARIAAGERWRAMAGRGRMPTVATLYSWRNKRPAFAEALAQAREIAAEGGGDLPCNLHLIEGDPMAEREVRPSPQNRRIPTRPGGRVSYARYGPATTRKICDRLAGGEHWSHFCGTPGMPSYRTFYTWLKAHPEFAEAVAEARMIGGEARFEKALDVAMAATPETVNADKLKVATLLRHAELLDPLKFSDKRRGGDGGEAQHVQTFIIRRFERAYRPDGTSYLQAIDNLQEVER